MISLSACPLPEAGGPRLHDRQPVRLADGSLAARIYGDSRVFEEFHCSYELSRAYQPLFEKAGLRVVGTGEGGEARVVEMDGHPFFVATLYLPQMRPAEEGAHPLIRAFVEAVSRANRQT